MRSTVAWVFACGLAASWLGLSGRASADDLIVNGGTMTLAGIHNYDHVCVINGGVLNVTPYAGNKSTGGNLELRASTIYVQAGASINARGAGYQPALCSNGAGPTATAGGRGGCAVQDSAGGGAHFGKGGRGTVDDPLGTDRPWKQNFPTAFEDDCNINFNTTTGKCSVTSVPPIGQTDCDGSNDSCRKFCWQSPKHALNSTVGDSLTCASPPCVGASVAGVEYWHNIYFPEFGAAGGDKGCRDGDGTTGNAMGGGGGGRVVLVGLTDRLSQGGNAQAPVACGTRLMAGNILIEGTIDAQGKRGCGVGNDSGGGGAGGSVLIVGDNVVIKSSAHVSAAGGLGGDTFAGAVGQPDYLDCPVGAQTGGTCDDCGGGGGGGIISVLSVTRTLEPGPISQFNVGGAVGGVCTICKGEAGGGAGELQLDGAYVGEFCDGFDNDFDGKVDEGLPSQSCGIGSCRTDIAACSSGAPISCMPNVSTDASCKATTEKVRPRVAVIIDTSASMLLNLGGYPTFGDGSLEHPGIGTNGDSRLRLAREALGQVISAYPEIDFSLARYHQDQGMNRSCQTATWFECQGLVASYDDPSDNTGTKMCDVAIGPDPDGAGAMLAPTMAVLQVSGPNATTRTECINYAGSCGPPRRGADVLSGFGTPVRDTVRWLDGRESKFSPDMTPGDVCKHSEGNDCELRGSGPTPLAGSLQAIEDYVSPIRSEDAAVSCRGYSVILVTDGAESCNGDPVAASQHLHSTGIDVNVLAVSVLDSEKASLNAIAAAGGTTSATFVTQPEQLVPALTSIIAGAIRSESCNGMDDDCDGKIDEDFPGLGTACDDHKKGVCRSKGEISCNSTHDGTECKITTVGQPPEDEKCNSFDDDCDGAIDEGLDCTSTNCKPNGEEICNGKDDDCDGKIDETDRAVGTPCGSSVGECRPGTMRCVLGTLRCIGETGPQAEQCNGKDDDCDGEIDNDAPCPGLTRCIEGACRNRCAGSEFSCPVGLDCVHSEVFMEDFCLPRACALCKSNERCVDDVCVDPCKDVACADGMFCIRGECRDCTVTGCPGGQLCYQRLCQADPCSGVSCGAREFCFNGNCVPQCSDALCPQGQSCNSDGACTKDSCASVNCADGEVCREGQCAEDPCRTTACGVGETCVAAMGCIADPCTVTTCGEGTQCSVSTQGAPRCQTPGTPQKRATPRYFSSSGSGFTACSVSAPGARSSGLGGALLVLLAIAGLRRVRRHPLQAAGLAAAAALASGCKTNAICLDCNQNDNNIITTTDASVDSGGGLVERIDAMVRDDEEGGVSVVDSSTGPRACTRLGDEVCNRLDDDCDGNIDEDFDFNTNVRHCGGCDQACQIENADATCEDGKCKAGECLAGFADLDGKTGCEYRCPVFPAQPEDCNGIDDDCDGNMDEELAAPSGSSMCRHTPGTPCENVQVICATRDKVRGWFCDYPDSVDFDPAIADGIRSEELRCDGLDNDCDGATDEPWPELGEPCDDGKIGACRDGGSVVCGSDQKTTHCDLSLPPNPVPGAGPDAPELCNDLDDNCDGIVDNSDPSDPKHIVDTMVHVNRSGHNFYIFTYEASRVDAVSDKPGITPSRACSKPDVQPWTYVSYAAATAACQAAGNKRLCTGDEWQLACEGSPATTYPYGSTYAADSCNGAEHDTKPGGGIDNASVATGSMAMCMSTDGTRDQSGNVKEWVNQAGTGGASIHVVRGGSYESPKLGLTCATSLSQATDSTVLPSLGFRCCSDSAP